VKDATQITVVLNDGREFPATVSGTDPRTDLALLKINEKDLPYLTFGDSDALEIGEWVVAIGTPFALESSLTVGVVSAKGRQDLGITSLEDFIQTDAAINPGNSGGPLLNLQGQVVGVNTAIMSRTGGYMGIGFSIPSHMVQHVIDQIMNGGCVKRAYLGIILQPIDQALADALGLEKTDGVLVSDVIKDSPAAKNGLQQGDIILQYNDKTVKSVAKFRNDIALMNPGDEVRLKVMRQNRSVDLKIALGLQNDQEVLSSEIMQKIGIDVENLSMELSAKLGLPSDASGVVITKVHPNSSAAASGLKPGFLVTGVAMHDNEPRLVKNTAEFEAALKEIGKRKHVILIVRHQNFQRYYTIKIG
jgi:serine protease Do